MPANKNALIRYKTIDRCLRNVYRRWTLDDLVDACSEALYETEGIRKGVCARTVQADIQMMRSDKLGYNAPIEVYEHKYYRYANREYSIMSMPMSTNELDMMREAVDMLQQLAGFDHFVEMSDVVSRLQDKLAVAQSSHEAIIHFDSVPRLKGLGFLNPLYDYIRREQTVRIIYKSFSTRRHKKYIFFPYLLKEFRNRWFVFGCHEKNMALYNLALDRIESVEPVNTPFKRNPDFNISHFFDDVIGVSKNIDDHPRTITFWASAKQSKYIQTKPLHSSQLLVSRNPDDGSCIFTINVVVNFELYSVLMSYGSDVRVLAPQDCAEYMHKKFREAVELYENDKQVF